MRFVRGRREALILIVVVVAVVVAVSHTWYDPKLSADATARALQTKLHTRYPFRCTRAEKDETIPLDDADYVCSPPRKYTSEDSYWVGTNSHRITDLLVMP
jgi:hypothetical protein